VSKDALALEGNGVFRVPKLLARYQVQGEVTDTESLPILSGPVDIEFDYGSKDSFRVQLKGEALNLPFWGRLWPPLNSLSGTGTILAEIRHSFEYSLRKRYKSNRNKPESLFAYWQRIAGWNSISKGKDRQILKRTVARIDRMLAEGGPFLHQTIKGLNSVDDSAVYEALLNVERYFTKNEKVFEILARMLLQGNTAEIQRRLRQTLSKFKLTQTKDVLLRYFENFPKNRQDVLYDASYAKYPGYEEIFAAGLKAEEYRIRNSAAKFIVKNNLSSCADAAAQAAEVESNSNTFWRLFAVLRQFKHKDCRRLLVSKLDYKDQSMRLTAAQTLLKDWPGDKEADQKAASVLIWFVENGRNSTTRYKYLNTLCQLDKDSALPVVLRKMKSSHKAEKEQMFRYLMKYWGDDPNLAEILRPFAQDKDLADKIKNVFR